MPNPQPTVVKESLLSDWSGLICRTAAYRRDSEQLLAVSLNHRFEIRLSGH
jgi:hypothetical protein